MTSKTRGGSGLGALLVAVLVSGGWGCSAALDEERDVHTAAPEEQVPDPWWCLDQAPAALPEPQGGKVVQLELPVVTDRLRGSTSVRSFTVTACEAADPLCEHALDPPLHLSENTPFTGSRTGTLTVPVPAGFDGFLRFEVESPEGTPEEQRYLPASYYLGGPTAAEVSRGSTLSFQRRDQLQFLVADRDQPPPGRGTLQVAVFDCNRQPASARLELVIEGDTPAQAPAFQIPASRIPVPLAPGTPPSTSANGVMGWSNLPPGRATLRAYRPGDTSAFGTLDVGVVADQLSLGPLLPEYWQDADLGGGLIAWGSRLP